MKVVSLFCVFVFLLSFSCFSQSFREVSGVVVHSDGSPVIGASVVADGSSLGVSTDLTGHFRLRVPSNLSWLSISFVGLQTVRVAVSDSVRVVLRAYSSPLDESVVVAYGRESRSNLVGSASFLDGDLFLLRPVSVISSALEGLVPGLRVGEGSGQPGASPALRLRGFGSVNAGNSPVIVIDGSLYNGELCDLNPSDIASLSVLRDAASCALYGSSAGNGVILITLRTGRSERPTLRFSLSQGFSERGIPEYNRVGVRDYYPLQWEMLRNGLISGGASAEDAALRASSGLYDKLCSNVFSGVPDGQIVLPDGSLNPAANALLYDDLDWSSPLERKGYRGEYQLSYGMRQDRGDFYASLGYLKENGFIVRSDLERISGRLSGNYRPCGWLHTGVSVGLVRSNGNLSDTQDNASDLTNPFYFTRYIGPIYPVYAHAPNDNSYVLDALGRRTYNYTLRGDAGTFDGRNIVEETLRNRSHFSRTSYSGRGFAEATLPAGFRARVSIGLDGYDQRRMSYEMKGPGSSPGRLSNSSTRGSSITANEQLEYLGTFGSHSVSVLAGHESYSYRYDAFSGNRQDQVLEDVYVMSNFLTFVRQNSYTDTYRKEAWFFRAGYSYADRYTVSGTYRRDGSSRFSPSCRWGSFWSLGAAWRLDRESFLRDLSGVDYLKLRVSYGSTGNDNILRGTSLPNTYSSNYYPWQSLYDLGQNNGLEPGVAFSSAGSRNLKWESQESFGVGTEFGFFGVVSGTLEYFRRTTHDLLFDVPRPLSSGISSQWENSGSVLNQGVEISLDLQLLRLRDWSWDLGFNGSFFRNTVTRMPSSRPEITDATRKLRKGQPLYNFWLRDYRGVDPETGDARYAYDSGCPWNSKVCYVDDSGDSLTYYNGYARFHNAGSPMPKFSGGVTTSVRWRNLSLDCVLAYSLGGKVYNTGYSVLMYNGKYGQALHRDILKRWQQPGDHTDVPRLDDGTLNKRLASIPSATQTNAVSDRWLFSASYLSVKSVTLSYRLPVPLLHRCGLSGMNIWASGENLFLLSAMKGLDPRQMYKGVISVAYPQARTLTFGLSLEI